MYIVTGLNSYVYNIDRYAIAIALLASGIMNGQAEAHRKKLDLKRKRGSDLM